MKEQYTFVCKCGHPITFLAYEAGDERTCMKCGRQFKVPLMLRTTPQVIQSMIGYRQLPGNDLCPISGERATHKLDILIAEVSSTSVSVGFSGAFVSQIAEFLGIPRLLASVMGKAVNEQETVEVTGIQIIVPIGVSEMVFVKAHELKHGTLLSALRTIPVYAHLLEEYPDAEATVYNPAYGDLA